jgi:hypothetical protein
MKFDSENNAIKEKKWDIPVERISDQKLLWGDNKEIKFSNNKKGQQAAKWGLLTIRDKKTPLSLDELAHIKGLTDKEDRFERTHHKYKKDKKRYPFLAKIEASVEDMEPSFLKELADEINSRDKITWDITLHGTTRFLHVDTVKQDFKITRTHLYNYQYDHSTFFNKENRIDYKKLKRERKEEIEHMKSKHATDDTQKDESKAKQIKVTVRKNKF